MFVLSALLGKNAAVPRRAPIPGAHHLASEETIVDTNNWFPMQFNIYKQIIQVAMEKKIMHVFFAKAQSQQDI